MFSGDEPPDLIKGSYTTDLNINKIHEAIEARFDYFKNNIIKFQTEIKQLEELIRDPSNFSLNDVKSVKNEIKNFQSISHYHRNLSKKIETIEEQFQEKQNLIENEIDELFKEFPLIKQFFKKSSISFYSIPNDCESCT